MVTRVGTSLHMVPQLPVVSQLVHVPGTLWHLYTCQKSHFIRCHGHSRPWPAEPAIQNLAEGVIPTNLTLNLMKFNSYRGFSYTARVGNSVLLTRAVPPGNQSRSKEIDDEFSLERPELGPSNLVNMTSFQSNLAKSGLNPRVNWPGNNGQIR